MCIFSTWSFLLKLPLSVYFSFALTVFCTQPAWSEMFSSTTRMTGIVDGSYCVKFIFNPCSVCNNDNPCNGEVALKNVGKINQQQSAAKCKLWVYFLETCCAWNLHKSLYWMFNSLAPERCGNNLKSVLSKHLLQFISTSHEIALRGIHRTPFMIIQHWFR